MKSVYFCGFMGSGKTTVGKILAQKLGLPFHDTDSMIEENENRTVSQVFDERSESEFRRLEKELIADLTTKTGPMVVALGGGALMDKTTLQRVKNHGILVFLKTQEAILKKRLHLSSARPLWTESAFETLYKVREPGYLSADLIVDCSDLSPEKIAENAILALSQDKTNT